LTRAEIMSASPVNILASIKILAGGVKSSLSSYHCCFVSSSNTVAAAVLPRIPADYESLVKVVVVSPFADPVEAALKHGSLINVHKAAELVKWLVQNNKAYKDHGVTFVRRGQQRRKRCRGIRSRTGGDRRRSP
jgi:hypothetical protein